MDQLPALDEIKQQIDLLSKNGGDPTLIRQMRLTQAALEHIETLTKCIHELAKAGTPFVHFIDQWERQPLHKKVDAFYGIHRGTEWEAELKLSDLRRLRSAFSMKYT